MKIKRDDYVVVVSGNNRGQGPIKVLNVDRGKNRVELQGIGFVYRHVKRGHPKSPQGGRVQIPNLVCASKVVLYCDSCKRGVRVGIAVIEGVKKRRCLKCSKSF